MGERKDTISAVDVGLNAVTLAATRTGNYLDVGTAKEVTLLFDLTYAAVTQLVFEVDGRGGKDDANNYEMLGASEAQTATDTDATLKPVRYVRAVSAADLHEMLTIPVYANYMRIRVLNTGGGASDILSVRVIKIMSN